MDILEAVKTYWGWVGIEPASVIAENEFANLIMKDVDGKFWRLCPEDLYCEVIAENDADYNELVKDIEFNQDWFMEIMVEAGEKKFGPLTEGIKYHMAVPGPLGGEYNSANIRTVAFEKIIKFSGELALEVKDLPDGEKVKIKSII